jgi:redox-sensitive bicupin YhaK (pirin superfamily)
MLEIRHSNERGGADHGWLQSRHSFSFADYYDPHHMGFGPLRVINEDWIQPAQGFGTHGHRDMEIITYVLEGALEHKDSTGTGSVIHYGDVQRMSAGSGVQHSEFNHSAQQPLHLLQIWIEPNVRGIPPGYEERHFDTASKQGRLRLIAAPDARDGALLIHQDACVYAALLDGSDSIRHALAPARIAYVHLIRGKLTVNGQPLDGGDAAKITQHSEVTLDGAQQAELLLFDLPA